MGSDRIQMINEISLAIGCSCYTREELYPRSEESKNGHLIFITGIVNSKSHPPTFRKFTDCFLTPPQTDFFAFDLTLMCRFNNGYIAWGPGNFIFPSSNSNQRTEDTVEKCPEVSRGSHTVDRWINTPPALQSKSVIGVSCRRGTWLFEYFYNPSEQANGHQLRTTSHLHLLFSVGQRKRVSKNHFVNKNVSTDQVGRSKPRGRGGGHCGGGLSIIYNFITQSWLHWDGIFPRSWLLLLRSKHLSAGWRMHTQVHMPKSED